MAKESETKTYGVGPSAEKANIGGDINQYNIVDEKGRAFQDGELVFDPTENPHELLQDDAKPWERELDEKNDAKQQSKKAARVTREVNGT